MAEPARGVRVRSFEDLAHLGIRQDRARQALLDPRKLDVRPRVMEQIAAPVEEAEEVLEHDQARPLVRRGVGLPVLPSEGVEVGLVRVEVLRLHLHQVEASPGEPLQEGVDGA